MKKEQPYSRKHSKCWWVDVRKNGDPVPGANSIGFDKRKDAIAEMVKWAKRNCDVELTVME